MDILNKIVSSEWFERSWTFQEGWLSKQTLFMFDDYLIDGRYIAGLWALNQSSYTDVGKYNSRNEFNKGTKKIATPVGWTYYRDGYTENDKVEMTLNQALKAIKNRKRFFPIDGIYSILGLLPYGEHVRIDYDSTPQMALEDVMRTALTIGVKKGNKFLENMTKGITMEDIPEEDKEEMEKFLEGISETVSSRTETREYFIEPLSWHGVSNTTPELCWMPYIDKTGSTSVEGGIDIRRTKRNTGDTDIDFTENGIMISSLLTANYIIQEIKSDLHKLEGGFEIDSGLYQKEVVVKLSDRKEGEIISLNLLGAQNTLNSAEIGNYLVVFDKEEFSSPKPFALLVKKVNEEVHVYHRLGLVELSKELKTGSVHGKTKILIGNLPINQLQTHIEIPPK